MNNPSAFPVAQSTNGAGDVIIWAEPGMTLRDYFAAHALAGIELTGGESVTADSPETRAIAHTIAICVYAIADAMLAERERRPQ